MDLVLGACARPHELRATRESATLCTGLVVVAETVAVDEQRRLSDKEARRELAVSFGDAVTRAIDATYA